MLAARARVGDQAVQYSCVGQHVQLGYRRERCVLPVWFQTAHAALRSFICNFLVYHVLPIVLLKW